MIKYSSKRNGLDIYVINNRIQVVKNGELVKDLHIPNEEFIEEQVIETIESIEGNNNLNKLNLRSII